MSKLEHLSGEATHDVWMVRSTVALVPFAAPGLRIGVHACPSRIEWHRDSLTRARHSEAIFDVLEGNAAYLKGTGGEHGKVFATYSLES